MIFTKATISDLLILYVRKRLLGKAAAFSIVALFFLFACLKAMSISEVGASRWWKCGYVVSLVCLALVGYLRYKSFRHKLENAYRVDARIVTEYQFTDSKVIISREGIQIELLWHDVKEVWMSRKIMILVDLLKKHTALPISMLGRPEKVFVVNKLMDLHLLKESEIKRLIEESNSTRQPIARDMPMKDKR